MNRQLNILQLPADLSSHSIYTLRRLIIHLFSWMVALKWPPDNLNGSLTVSFGKFPIFVAPSSSPPEVILFSWKTIIMPFMLI